MALNKRFKIYTASPYLNQSVVRLLQLTTVNRLIIIICNCNKFAFIFYMFICHLITSIVIKSCVYMFILIYIHTIYNNSCKNSKNRYINLCSIYAFYALVLTSSYLYVEVCIYLIFLLKKDFFEQNQKDIQV